VIDNSASYEAAEAGCGAYSEISIRSGALSQGITNFVCEVLLLWRRWWPAPTSPSTSPVPILLLRRPDRLLLLELDLRHCVRQTADTGPAQEGFGDSMDSTGAVQEGSGPGARGFAVADGG
jgi:hypothetical protein